MRRATALLLICLPACAFDADELVDEDEAALTGDTRYSSCTLEEQAFLDQAMHYGRIAAASDAYRLCIEQRMPSYTRCGPRDPVFVSGAVCEPSLQSCAATAVPVSAAQVIALARKNNPIVTSCTGGHGGHASTQYGGYDHSTPDSYSWDHQQLTDFKASYQSTPMCASSTQLRCRRPMGPFDEVAATAWHEAMHTHGFGHDQPDAPDCNGNQWVDIYEQSVPVIAEECLLAVLYDSGFDCGGVVECGSRGLMIVQSVDFVNGTVSACTCVEDPNVSECVDIQDQDRDFLTDACDNCRAVANVTQTDGDADRAGDACDNCLARANPDQRDGDGDRLGDLCDNCPARANADQRDGDGDRIGDACDNCPALWNSSQADKDGDLIGDSCDNDADGDGFPNSSDNCWLAANPSQADSDRDGLGDACDSCDFTRGTPRRIDCDPSYWLREMMFIMDKRLAGIAKLFAQKGPSGPWGPWAELRSCRWGGCEGAQVTAGYDSAKALEVKAVTESQLFGLLAKASKELTVTDIKMFKDARLYGAPLPGGK